MSEFPTAVDQGWKGIVMRDPASLPPGIAYSAQNRRFSNGEVSTRRGCRPLGWTTHDTTSVSAVLPLGPVHGAAVWADPSTNIEWIIVAAGGAVWKMRQGQAATSVSLPTGITLSGKVNFTACMNVMVMHRGPDLEPLVMISIETGFGTVPINDDDDGTSSMPWGSRGLYFQNRLWVPNANDLVSYSDYLDYTRYDASTQAIWVEKGAGDGVVGLYKFNDASLIVFKSRSVHVILNLVPSQGEDLVVTYPSAYHDEVTREYGASSADAVVAVGADVWFLADERGIVSIRQTETNKLQGKDVPISDDIQPLIAKIDWQWASRACAATWDNKVYFAVSSGRSRQIGTGLAPAGIHPSSSISVAVTYGAEYFWEKGASESSLTNGSETLYESGWFTAEAQSVNLAVSSGAAVTFTLARYLRGYNDLVLVYDTKAAAWSGFDTGDAIAVQHWVKLHYGDQLRLAFVTPDGYLMLYEDAFSDGVPAEDGSVVWTPIDDPFVTRGYYGDASGIKRFRSGEVVMGLWNPEVELASIVDGVDESAAVTTITKQPEKHYQFAAEDYDLTNANDDHDSPGRQDYSVAIPEEGLFIGSGLMPDLHQEAPEKFWLRQRGRFCQLSIRSIRGRSIIKRIEISAVPGRDRKGSHA